MKFLSILLCATSATAFAQQQNNNPLYTKMTGHMKPQVKEILAKQLAAQHGLNKTTVNKQRLVGFSAQNLMTGDVDSTYLGYSGLRGSSFANCLDNMNGYDGSYSKADTVWRFTSGALHSDMRYTYDSHDSVLTIYDAMAPFSMVYTLDNADNAIVTDIYDTSGGQPTHMVTYSQYDNQKRKTYDSTDGLTKTMYGYAPGVDSALSYYWDGTQSVWIPTSKIVHTYNSANLMTGEYSYQAGANSWDPAYRTTYTYNNSGFLATTLSETFDANIGWANDYKEAFGYTGSNALYNTYEAYYTDQNGSWIGDTKFDCTINSAGNWGAFHSFEWGNANSFDSSARIDFTYNNFNYITEMDFYYYDYTTGAYDPTVLERDNYYYQTYNVPDAVTTVHTAVADITTYPNPVSGKLHIGGNIGSKNVSMQIISITGARLFNTSGNWQSMNKDIDMSSFANGVYYLVIADENGNKIAAKQIVKN
ncbi:T9SS type A sorting domain-containing protein [Taibaiella soli]|nr:T9SS type A sorting domain-containing protein [Taibaiella soli]